ncbi:surfeit locus protein 1-like isoform X4 [Olea europaea var. sylvestris]|uniref:surfeit locus protein 1-like isoform X4 n=1 Tax=Olea europaea var. sylvestris TaxID=158386 RepID=UPI000C1D0BF1|nr:surfeit locus protein 1-like isoform X4 [Olea europaea var. sylvestris]
MAAASISRTIERNLRPINLSKSVPPPSSLFSTTAPGISTDPQQPQGSNKERSTWSKVLLFVPGAITFGLGTWQIFRRQDKIKMLEYRQNRLGLEPLKSNKIATSSENFDSLEFRRVQCRGFFDEKKSIYVGPRSRSISGVTENGYYLITPLLPSPDDPNSLQTPILVNRGWVPRSWRDKALKVSKDDELSSVASTPAQESAKSSWWRFWSKKPIIVELLTLWKFLELYVAVRSQAYLFQQMIPVPLSGFTLTCLLLLVLVDFRRTHSTLKISMIMSTSAILTLFQRMLIHLFVVQ